MGDKSLDDARSIKIAIDINWVTLFCDYKNQITIQMPFNLVQVKQDI